MPSRSKRTARSTSCPPPSGPRCGGGGGGGTMFFPRCAPARLGSCAANKKRHSLVTLPSSLQALLAGNVRGQLTSIVPKPEPAPGGCCGGMPDVTSSVVSYLSPRGAMPGALA